MSVRTALLTSALLIAASSARPSFAVGADATDFLSRWIATPTLRVKSPEGLREGRIFQRLVAAGDTRFPVGSLVHFRYPSAVSAAAGGIEGLSTPLREALGARHWRERRQKHARVFEAEWTATGRFVRVYVAERGGTTSLSVAIFRTAYADSVLLESELIQRELAGAQDEPMPALRGLYSRIDSWLGAPAAHAEDCPKCAPGDFLCLLAASACRSNQVGTAVGGLNQGGLGSGGLGNLGTQLPGLSQKLGDLDADWRQSNGLIADLQKDVRGFRENDLPELKGGLKKANENWEQSNQTLKDTNALLKDFMRPERAFFWAAAGTAGAALGAIAVNLAVDAIAAGGSAIYEALTKEKAKTRIIETFRKARETWETLTNAATELERAIDGVVELRELSRQFRVSREFMLTKLAGESDRQAISRQLGEEQVELAARQRLHEKRLDDAILSEDRACILKVRSELREIADTARLVGRIRQHYEEAQPLGAFCRDLRKKMNDLRIAEGELQKARAILLGAESDAPGVRNGIGGMARRTSRAIFLERLEEDYSEAQKRLERGRDGGAQEVPVEREAAAEQHRRAQAALEKLRAAEIARCERDEAPRILRDIPLIGRPVQKLYSGRCNRLFRGGQLPSSRYYAEQSRIEAEAHAARNATVDSRRARAAEIAPQVRATTAIHAEMMKAYLSWFSQLEREQACASDADSCTRDDGANLVARFRSLQAKSQRIDEVCGAEE